MTALPPNPVLPSRTDPGDVGGRAAHGFAWLGVQSVVEKVASGLGQIVLAWLLAPEAFKLVGLTYTITVFASLMQSAGLREVLQQRQKRLDVWATPGFWLSLTLGLAAAGAVVAVAPWASRFYAEPRLVPLLLVSAVTLPLSSLGIVPEVMLRSRMHFRLIAMTGALVLVGQMILSIAFAGMGLGALSIILPQPILALIRLVIYWSAARPRIRHGPRPRRWRFLIGDSAAMLAGSIAFMLTYQGGQIVLGRVHPQLAEAGIYYFCTVLADQSVRVLVNNLGGVLLPALSRLQNDRARLTRAFQNASGLLLLVGIPLCALQGILAGPLIRLFFSQKWLPAIPCFAALSIALIGRLAFGPSESMLVAQGRFRTYMFLAFAYAAAFLGSVVLAVRLVPADGAAAWTAIAGGACLLVMGPCALRLAIGRGGLGWKGIWRLYQWPVACTLVSAAPTATLVAFMPHSTWADIVTVVTGTASCTLLYITFIRRCAPRDWNQLVGRMTAVSPAKIRPALARLLPLASESLSAHDEGRASPSPSFKATSRL